MHCCKQSTSNKLTVYTVLPELAVAIICGAANHVTRFIRYHFGSYSEETVFSERYSGAHLTGKTL